MSSEDQEVLVSVIIPAYNAESTLSQTLDSLVVQTLKEIEIIVVDDGSTDKTGEIISRYQTLYPGKIVKIQKENEGVSKARNTGLDIAKGKYVGFVDADDTVVSDMFEKMYQYAVETNADLVQCWRYDVTEDSEEIRGPHKNCEGADIFENPEIVSAQTLFVWDKLFRRRVIDENKIRFAPFRYAEDILFVFQLELYCKNIVELQEPLYRYWARRSGAVTASFGDALLDSPKAMAAINDLALDFGCFSQIEKHLWKVEANLYIRRLNDFFLYENKELQEEIARAYFELFDRYFYGWEKTIRKTGTETHLEQWVNAYRSDWNKTIKFIRYPRLWKRLCRKPVHLTVKFLKWVKRIKRKGKAFINKAKEKGPAVKYAHYLKQPIKKNVVLLTSYFGSSFSDSIYYMAREFLQTPGITVYVGTNSIRREKTFINYNHIEPILADVNSDLYLEILATAQYLVCNSRFPSFFSKREEQVYLNTWHGTPLKTLGKNMRHGLKDVGNNQTNFLMCDYLLYPNEYTRKNMMQSFFLDRLYTQKVVMCGYPRNAPFFDPHDAVDLRKKLGLDGKRVYLYMPTWRGETVATAEVAAYTKELEALLEAMDESLSDDIVVFVKLHQVVMRKIKIKNYKHLRLPHPLYENYRFVNIADGLITDYSSVFFDFANSRKEIILFTYDYDRYMEQRGMYFDMRQLPFQRINTVEGLVDHLNKCETFEPDEQYARFCHEYCKYDSVGTPQYACQLMLYGNPSDAIDLVDYKENGDIGWHIKFMSPLNTPQERETFSVLVDKAKSNDLFVFAQWSFSKKTDSILVQYANNSHFTYVVAPGEMPATKWEYVKLLLFRKFSLFRRNASRLYLYELQRILPNIKIASITNFSDDPKFIDICRAVKSQFPYTEM